MVKFCVCLSILVTMLTFSNAQALELKIVSDPFPPLGYVNKDGKIVGMAVDIVKALLEETGIDGKFSMLPWARAYHMAKTEENVLIFSLTKTEERERIFKLVGPIFSDKAYLYKLKKRNDIQLSSLNDAKKFYIGVVNKYYSHQYLVSKGFEIGKNLDIVFSPELNFRKFINERFDLMISIETYFNYQVKESGFDPEIFEKALLAMSIENYLGFSAKTDDEIINRFKQALKKIKSDGTFDKIADKYRRTHQYY